MSDKVVKINNVERENIVIAWNFTDLLPCPFCGANNRQLSVHIDDLDCYAECSTCLTVGPSGENEELAIQLWNKRYTILYRDKPIIPQPQPESRTI